MDYYTSRQLERYIFLFKGQEGKIFLMLNEWEENVGQTIWKSRTISALLTSYLISHLALNGC